MAADAGAIEVTKTGGKLITIFICAGLLLLFAGISFRAWMQKGATFDEPVHMLGALIQVHDFDFRCDPDNPPVWKYYVGLGTRKDSVKIDRNDSLWSGMLTSAGSWAHLAQMEMTAQPRQMITAIDAGRVRMIFIGMGAPERR